LIEGAAGEGGEKEAAENQSNTLVEDALENLMAAIQISEDFIN